MHAETDICVNRAGVIKLSQTGNLEPDQFVNSALKYRRTEGRCVTMGGTVHGWVNLVRMTLTLNDKYPDTHLFEEADV